MASSPVAAVGIPLIALALAGLFVAAVHRVAPALPAPRKQRRLALVALGTALWLALLAVAASSGLLLRFDLKPPPMAFLVVGSLGMGLALGLSRIGAWLAAGLPLSLLVGWQAFRLPLELVMHRAAEDGLMPQVMSFSGYNFDIVSGCAALLLSLLMARRAVPHSVVVAFNVLGIALLTVVVTIAVLATPLVRAFGDAELNTWVAYFPYVWLPGVMVAGAVMGHVVLSRRLLAEARARRADLDRAPA